MSVSERVAGVRRDVRRPIRVLWAALWSVLIWPLFVGVTVLTLTMWVVNPDYTETTPVGDLSFFALGAMIGAGFASQVRRQPPAAGAVQALLASASLAVAGLLGGRIEPLVGGVLLTAAGVALALLHPQPGTLLHGHGGPGRVGLGLTLVSAVVGLGYTAVVTTLALGAGPSCFLGRCVHGDRLAEMAATALAIPALAALAAWRVDGWRLPLWSAGLSAIGVGAICALLPHVPGSLGVAGGMAAIAWGVVLIAAGERDRLRTHRGPDTEKG
jgi:hypothetical protein